MSSSAALDTRILQAEVSLAGDNALYLVKVANSGGGALKDRWVPAGHNKHRHRGSPAHVAEKEEAQLEVQSLLDRPGRLALVSV